MKIAISGSAGVGKSTTARALAEHLSANGPRHTCVEGIGKRLMIERYGSPKVYGSFDAEQMLEHNTAILNAKIGLETKLEHFVSDRTCLDYLAIMIAHSWEVANWAGFQKLMARCAEHDGTYSLIAMLPHASIGREDDGIRFMNDTYQFMIEVIGRGLYQKHKIPLIEIRAVTLPDRLAAILNLSQPARPHRPT